MPHAWTLLGRGGCLRGEGDLGGGGSGGGGTTSRALSCPTKPAETFSAVPSERRPRPLMCVCAAVRFSRALPDLTSLIVTISGCVCVCVGYGGGGGVSGRE